MISLEFGSGRYRKNIFLFIVAFLTFFQPGKLLVGLSQYTIFAADELNESTYYYPLAIGNQWEFETHYLEKGREATRHESTLITGKQDIGGRMIRYYRQNGKEFVVKAQEGILTPTGVFLLKHPITQGREWVSGKDIDDQRLFRVEGVGLSKTVRGKEYNNCIKVVVTSDFHALLIEGKITYLAVESHYYYAPKVGPILIETFDITRSGRKTPFSRTELISFNTNQEVPEFNPVPRKTQYVGITESFRFPEKGFIHPILSPNDRWLIYQKSRLVWEKLFYCEPGKNDERIVPVCPPGQEKLVQRVWYGKWSADGTFFAVPAEIAGDEKIVVVDFRGDQPRFLEWFSAEDGPYFWSPEGFLVYRVGIRTVMKKYPKKAPEKLIQSQAGPVDFHIAADDTLIYGLHQWPKGPVYYQTNLHDPSIKTRIFPDLRIDGLGLSPTGEYALLYDLYTDQKNRTAFLANLKTHEIKCTWAMGDDSSLNEAKWSPDGTSLAYLEKVRFQKDKMDPSRVTRVNPHFIVLDLRTAEQKDFGIGVSEDFNWTPDSRHIIHSLKYAHESLGMYKNGIFVMRISDGKEIGQLSKISAHQCLYMSNSLRYVVWQALNMDTFFIAENVLRPSMLGQ
jgi:hypothetical protein